MKKILVPCDFSTQSFEAFKTALKLAEKTKGEVILLHAIYIPTYYDPVMVGDPVMFNPQLTTQLEEDAKKRFNEWTKLKVTQAKVQLEIVWANVLFSVIKTIEDKNIDLVVMGTSGASGLSGFFIGSNTEKIVRHSPVPVVAIHDLIDFSSLKNILLPSTLTLNQSDFVKKLKELQQLFHAHLHILFINTPGDFKQDREVTEMMEEFIKHYQLSNYTFHVKNNATVENGIADFVAHEKIDLIAMATHARKGIAHLFNTNITEDVVNHLRTSVWSYRLK
jgi:nucleotide-binding universal stress UspA family protein